MSYNSIQSSAGILINPGPGLPAISKKAYETICAGGYIDFAQLPAAKRRRKQQASWEGQVVLVQAAVSALGARPSNMGPVLFGLRCYCHK